MNVAGRVMLTLSRLGGSDARRLRIYIDAVGAAVDRQLRVLGDEAFNQIESIMDRQAALLEHALQQRMALRSADEAAARPDGQEIPDQSAEPRTADNPSPTADAAAVPVLSEKDLVPDAGATGEETAEAGPDARRRQPSGYVPQAKSMEEKLQDSRKPIQKLLTEDCVTARLLDRKQAGRIIAGMAGKRPEDAEREIVEKLREILQQQVRAFIRKSKGGPWATPREQNDLRQDIHAATTIRGVLLLSRQILKEREEWEKEHGRIGILGLFAARR